tara:strand:- start:1094 stop:1858 length:765 start_codon:yes stop_codon:yes gene_type:complete
MARQHNHRKNRRPQRKSKSVWTPQLTSPAYYVPAAGDVVTISGLNFGNTNNITGIIELPEDYSATIQSPLTIASGASLKIPEGSVVIIKDETAAPEEASDLVTLDYNTTTFENQLSDGQAASGDILKYEPGGATTLTKGRLYFLHTDGTWDETDADAAATGKQLLGVALGTSAKTHGLLLRGFVKIPSTEVLNLPGSGASDGLPLYISTTGGHLDFTAPSATGDIVRVVGYCIDDDSSDILLYFRPDNTWVEIA